MMWVCVVIFIMGSARYSLTFSSETMIQMTSLTAYYFMLLFWRVGQASNWHNFCILEYWV